MPRTKEQNEEIRNKTKNSILDAALSLYVIYGFNGTDMDYVAAEAGVAKGLLYYYFKTKKLLFRELFNSVLFQTLEFSNSFLIADTLVSPLEKLIKYSIDIFGIGFKDPRYIQFAMRMPFDTYAVFGPDEWSKGLEGSRKHIDNLNQIISEGIADGSMKCRDAGYGANSFWTVYVAALFNFTKMTSGKGNDIKYVIDYEIMSGILSFGMAGLGVEGDSWKKILKKHYEKEEKNESI